MWETPAEGWGLPSPYRLERVQRRRNRLVIKTGALRPYRNVTEYGYVLPGPGPRPRSAPRLAARVAAGAQAGSGRPRGARRGNDYEIGAEKRNRMLSRYGTHLVVYRLAMLSCLSARNAPGFKGALKIPPANHLQEFNEWGQATVLQVCAPPCSVCIVFDSFLLSCVDRRRWTRDRWSASDGGGTRKLVP